MSHSHAELFGINIIILWFYTVYGSLARPNMAIFLFTDIFIKKNL